MGGDRRVHLLLQNLFNRVADFRFLRSVFHRFRADRGLAGLEKRPNRGADLRPHLAPAFGGLFPDHHRPAIEVDTGDTRNLKQLAGQRGNGGRRGAGKPGTPIRKNRPVDGKLTLARVLLNLRDNADFIFHTRIIAKWPLAIFTEALLYVEAPTVYNQSPMRRLRDLGFTLSAAALLASATPYSPNSFLTMARLEPGVGKKVFLLRRCMQNFPLDPRSREARSQLISLLIAGNRYEEALQEYRQELLQRKPGNEADLKFLELLLKTGRSREVISRTARVAVGKDPMIDRRVFEFRVQAFLAQGQYREARQTIDQWLGMHGRDEDSGSRASADIDNLKQVRRYLYALENAQGPLGKPLFTASVPDSLTRWSRRQNVPVIFFRLIPADASENPADSNVIEKTKDEATLRALVSDMNRGFRYLSGGSFSLSFGGVETLYGKSEEVDPFGAHAGILTTRVYIHTIAPLYRLAGQAFVVLLDGLGPVDEGTAYMGDGLIRIAASKLNSVTLMHEVLHGLGATHQDWATLTRMGYQFDPEDKGLMTFRKGELLDFGLEEKNRVLLDWPHVLPVSLPNENVALSAVTLPSTVRNSNPH
jgi:tetratricopeptide (TPR) repeat protein